jgi:hypothetical protein
MGVSPSRMPSGVGTEWLPWGFPSSPSMDLSAAAAAGGATSPVPPSTSPGARPAPAAGHGTHIGAPPEAGRQGVAPTQAQPMTGAVGAVGGSHGGSQDTALLQAMLADAISQVGCTGWHASSTVQCSVVFSSCAIKLTKPCLYC